MSKLTNFTKKQLNKILIEAEAELRRRAGVEKATKEISRILKKHSITIDEIDIAALRAQFASSQKGRLSTAKNAKKVRKTDNRASVAAKYKSLNGCETWTGRGRAPKWVITQCERESITLDTFKQDARFMITQ